MSDRYGSRLTAACRAGLAAALCLASPAPAEIVANFAGQVYSGLNPPNPVGDVGPERYVQAIQGPGGTQINIYTKSGSLVAGPVAIDTLGSGDCASGAGGPNVLWDPLADRWVLAEYSSSGNRICVYVSQTPEPTGAWYAYAFTAPQFPDFPVLAVWHDAYYVTTHESGHAAYALNRAAMLAGAPAGFARFTAPRPPGFPFQSLTPADLDGPTPPPAGSPAFLLRHRDDEVHDPGSANPLADYLDVFEFHADFATAAHSFGYTASIPIGEFSSDLCGLTTLSCIPQPGTAVRLDPHREQIMHRLAYRNFGTHESIVGSFVTNLDLSGATTRAGVRWFELRKNGGGSWTLFQEGTYSPDAHNRWIPAIAMNGDQHVAVGYAVSSASVFPGLRYAGRVGSDPLGLLSGETSLIEGAGSSTSIRWGDLFAMSVDPTDDCTFWFTGEWMTGAAGNWATRIAAFRLQECPEPAAAAFAALLTLGAIASRAAATPRCAARARRAPGRTEARRRAAPPRRDRRS